MRRMFTALALHPFGAAQYLLDGLTALGFHPLADNCLRKEPPRRGVQLSFLSPLAPQPKNLESSSEKEADDS